MTGVFITDVALPDFIGALAYAESPFALALRIGAGCAAGTPVLTAPPPVLGSIPSITLVGAQATAPGLLLISALPSLASPLAPTCIGWIDFATATTLATPGTDASGSWTLPIVLPPTPILAGARAMLQAGVIDPTASLGVAVSNGLFLRLGL